MTVPVKRSALVCVLDHLHANSMSGQRQQYPVHDPHDTTVTIPVTRPMVQAVRSNLLYADQCRTHGRHDVVQQTRNRLALNALMFAGLSLLSVLSMGTHVNAAAQAPDTLEQSSRWGASSDSWT